jgi:hypothetical protein
VPELTPDRRAKLAGIIRTRADAAATPRRSDSDRFTIARSALAIHSLTSLNAYGFGGFQCIIHAL